MVKMIALYAPPPDRNAFDDHYQRVHLPLLRKTPGLQRVEITNITGTPTEAFCTGADIKEWDRDFTRRPSDFYKWMGVFIETFERLRTIGKPTIARINGMVVGGGNELQISCDLAIAAEDISIRHVGVARGSVPAAGATQWLPILIGERRGPQMVFLFQPGPPPQAPELGAFERVVPGKK